MAQSEDTFGVCVVCKTATVSYWRCLWRHIPALATAAVLTLSGCKDVTVTIGRRMAYPYHSGAATALATNPVVDLSTSDRTSPETWHCNLGKCTVAGKTFRYRCQSMPGNAFTTTFDVTGYRHFQTYVGLLDGSGSGFDTYTFAVDGQHVLTCHRATGQRALFVDVNLAGRHSLTVQRLRERDAGGYYLEPRLIKSAGSPHALADTNSLWVVPPAPTDPDTIWAAKDIRHKVRNGVWVTPGSVIVGERLYEDVAEIPGSDAEFDVYGYDRFQTTVAMEDGAAGSATFRGFVDGDKVFEATVRSGSKPVMVIIPLTGRSSLTLSTVSHSGGVAQLVNPSQVEPKVVYYAATSSTPALPDLPATDMWQMLSGSYTESYMMSPVAGRSYYDDMQPNNGSGKPLIFDVRGLSRFTAYAGVLDGHFGSANFQVDVDGVQAWGGMAAASRPAKKIDVSLEGHKTLTLFLQQVGGEGGGYFSPKLLVSRE